MAGTTWNVFIPGTKIKSAEVNANFDWIEGDLAPMIAGSKTDATYSLGEYGGTSTSYYRYKDLRISNAINPDTTTAGIAMGQATADSSACLDLSAMQQAIYFPKMSTTARDNLTPQNGFSIFNTTAGEFQFYEGGQWIPMGTQFGLKGKLFTITTSQTGTQTNTSVSVSGFGRANYYNYIFGNIPNLTANLRVVVDGLTYPAFSLTAHTVGTAYYVTKSKTDTTTTFALTNGVTPLDAYFKNSISFEWQLVMNAGVSTMTAYLLYESS